jgi:uncharacterized protein (UPF0332 family)
MVFDWTDFIHFAQSIADAKSNQATLRSCISRAYYGAFGKTRTFCYNRSIISSKEKAGPDLHKILIEKLKSSEVSLERSIGNLLHELRHKRNDSDYNVFFQTSLKEVDEIIYKANIVIKKIKELDE